ncbi:hypothetical protein ABTX81_23530 [Kitasatospora sp. NPDC097605]|uniref:hypothetical protein n=1 Tax=Kitasatospora sp. NPDC097605 TaxID=3157226 RepID=UPI00332ED740
MNGPMRITVLDKDAYYEQRAVVFAPYGTLVLEGRIGASLDVQADEWELELQHCAPGVGWRPNIRVLPYPWQTSPGGLRSRIVRSKDCDWPGGDPTERNFILRLSATVAERPAETPSPTDALGPATRGGVRTSSGAVGGQLPAVHGTAPGQDAALVPAVHRAGGPLRPQAARLPVGRVLPAEYAAPAAPTASEAWGR